MAYKNHIILRGLDEARAHQRGEVAGRVPVAAEQTKERIDTVLNPPPKRTRKKPEGDAMGRRRHHSDEFRLKMATTLGTYKEVAAALDVPYDLIKRMRNLYHKGKMSVDGKLVKPDPAIIAARNPPPKVYPEKPVNPNRATPQHKGRPHPTKDQKRLIAMEAGTPVEVGKRHGVHPVSVRNWRTALAEGKL